jgi:hypothetical protein
MIDPSDYSFERLRDDGELIFPQRRRARESASVLLLSASWEHPSPSSINRIRHAYSLRDELDSSWAIRPFDLLNSHGNPVLLLDDPGRYFLDEVLVCSPSLEELLRLAIARALTGLHARELNHRDVKSANVIANAATGNAWLTGLQTFRASFSQLKHVPGSAFRRVRAFEEMQQRVTSTCERA